MLLPHREVLFGGAAGGGKSDWLLRSALQYVDIPGYSALILRRSVSSLFAAGGLVPRSQEWLADTDGVWNEQKKTWFFPNGATIQFGYLDSPSDKYKYQSSEYQFIGFEELTEFPREEDYAFLISRLRAPTHGPLAGVPWRMRATTNPIGVGFAWVKARFVPNGQPINTPDRFFLQSFLEDNPSIDLKQYEAGLIAMGDEVTFRKLRKGDWSDMVAGEYFPKDAIVDRIISPRRIPRNILATVRAWDLAGTEPSLSNPDPDWTVGVKMAKFGNKHAPEWLIWHVNRFRKSPDKTEQDLKAQTVLDGRQVYSRIEQEPGQSGKAQVTHLSRVLAGYDFDGIRVSGGDSKKKEGKARSGKEIRAIGLSSQWRQGNVWLVDDGTGWIQSFVDELDAFPFGKHDDQVDAATLGFNFLLDAKTKHRGQAFGPRLM